MGKTIKIINDELVEIASYRNPEIVFHDSNNPRYLKPEYDNFESYCDFKEVINPFELYAENQQLKKQKDDVVEFINKHDLCDCEIKRCMCYKSIKDKLLRMLGEKDVED